MSDTTALLLADLEALERETAEFADTLDGEYQSIRAELNQEFSEIDKDIEGIAAFIESDTALEHAAE